jgi:transcription antitermination factor NusG
MPRAPAAPLKQVHRQNIAPARQTPQWYAIQVRYRFEKQVASQLQSKGLETYLPLLAEIHHWSDRRQPVDVPLFPGYAFVRVDRSSGARLGVLHTGGIIGFVSFGNELVAIPVKQIDDLKMLLAQKVPCSLYPFLRVGQRVRIRGGCLDGLEGILDQHQEKNLVIAIECIERSVAIKIEGYELELI